MKKITEKEVIKLLGDRFHLTIKSYLNEEKKEYILFKKYDDLDVYYSDANKPLIKCSDINQLYDYAKKHHIIDEDSVLANMNFIMAFICFIFSIINLIFIKNSDIAAVIFGIQIMIIINSIISFIIFIKNHNVIMMELDENFNKHMKTLNDLIDKKNN